MATNAYFPPYEFYQGSEIVGIDAEIARVLCDRRGSAPIETTAQLVEIVDAVGGVDLEITDAEREQINYNVKSARKVFRPLGYTAAELLQSGENTHLTGLQALGYARIRKIDSDVTRAFRQRKLLNALLGKIRGNLWNPVMLFRLGRAIMNSTRTNMSAFQLISLGEKALAAGRAEQLRIPVPDSYDDNGSSLKITDWQANIGAFQTFVYGS